MAQMTLADAAVAPRNNRKLLIGLAVASGVVLAGGAGAYVYLRRSGDPMVRAQSLTAAGNLRAAQVELRNAIRADPRNAEAHLQMAKLQMKLADPVAAEVEFKAARAVGADQWVVLPLLGEAMIAEGLNKETLTVVPARGPTPQIAARNLLMRSVAQLSLGDTKAATETLALIEKAAPGSVESVLIGARLAAARGDFPATEAKVDEVLRLDPAQIDALLMKEQLVTSKGDHEAGLALADRAVASAPWSAMARMRRANQLMFKGEDAKAQGDIDAVLEVQPRFIEAVYLKALIMARKGRFQDAAIEMDRLSSAAAKFPQALYYQAMLSQNLGRAETAVDFARRYYNLVPGDPDGVRLLARTELATKRPDQAMTLLEKAVAGGQADAETLDLLGSAYAMQGVAAKALETFRKASTLAPNDSGILAHYGVTQVQLGQIADASATLERSIELSPVVNPTAGEALVSAALGLGDVKRAETALAQLKAKVGDTEGVGILEGLIRVRQNEPEAARIAFAATLKRFPGSSLAKLNLARVIVGQGHRAEGMAMMAEILAKSPADSGTLESYVPLLIREKQLPPALQVLEAAHAARPEQIAFTVMLGDVLTLMGNPQRAITVLTPEPGTVAPSLPILAALARAQTGAGQLDAAKATYREVLRRTPTDLLVRGDLESLLLRTKDMEGARAVLQEGLAVGPGNFRIMTNLVAMETTASGVDKGLAVAAALRQVPSNMPLAALLKGDALSRANRPKDAAQAYLDEFKAAPSGELLMRMVRAQVAAGQTEDAARFLRDWLAQYPETPDAAQALAQIDIGAKRYGDAEAHLATVLARRPNDSLALNNLAYVYSVNGDKRARDVAQRAYLQNPTADAADTLGWIMVQAGDVKTGLPLLQQSGAQRPRDPAIQYHLAAALKADGQNEAALKVVEPIVTGPAAFEEKADARKLLDQVKPRK